MDYNLFPVFVEIMRYRNISKAASALGMTQPAASNALSRLRHQFGDPLFIRVSHGVTPTEYAINIAEDVEHHVNQLRSITHTQSKKIIDLNNLKRKFKIIMYDLEQCLFLPHLVPILAEQAPNIQLEILSYQRNSFKQDILGNQVDLVMAYLRDPHKNLITQELTYQDFVCVCATTHPSVISPLTLDQYTSLSHVIVSPDKGGFKGLIDEKLQSMNKTRTVAISTPHFLTACQFVANSKYLLTIPRLLAQEAIQAFNLQLLELPLTLEGFSTSMHWHRRFHNDPEHTAIRELILKSIQSL